MRSSCSPSVARRVAVPAAVVVAALGLALALFLPVATRRPVAPATAGVTSTAGARGLGSTVLVDSSSPNRSAQLALGKTLYEENCSTCHGAQGAGSSFAPNLRGLGAGTIDLWVSSGWMPLANPTVQPVRKPSRFNRAQTVAIANYVASLAPGGVAIPSVDLKGSNVADGFSVFALNCAPCHTITGAGDALANGISAPTLHDVTATQVEEAVRSGPGNMPRFSSFTVSKQQLNDVVAYVTRNLRHPENPGGLGLGGVGPVAEGFVGLFVGVGLCVLAALWIGERNERDDEPGHGDGPAGDHGPSDDEIEAGVVHA